MMADDGESERDLHNKTKVNGMVNEWTTNRRVNYSNKTGKHILSSPGRILNTGYTHPEQPRA